MKVPSEDEDGRGSCCHKPHGKIWVPVVTMAGRGLTLGFGGETRFRAEAWLAL